MSRLLGRILSTFACALIFFIAYSSQLFIFWPYYGRVFSVRLLTALVPFNILVGFIWWNYALVVRTSPGRVPEGWQPDTREGATVEVKQANGRLRFCRTCKVYKPPRAHHCRECRACTLRMDHHCPWVNNCVGHYNYASFIRFLVFVDLACSYHLVLLGGIVWDYMNRPMYMFNPKTSDVVIVVLNFATCVPVLCGVGLFSLYHFYLLMTNTTTIEAWEKDKVAMLIRRGRIEKVKFPYHLGALRNLYYVLGPSPLLWWWPSSRVQGDGLGYPVAADTDTNVQYTWPPKDPTTYFEPRPMPSTPWTYGSSVNPHLQPSNTRLRSTAQKSAVPPYHADYDGQDDDASSHEPIPSSESEAESETYDHTTGRPWTRRGSEGWEIRPLTAEAREEIVRRYMMQRGLDQDQEPAPPPYVDDIAPPETPTERIRTNFEDEDDDALPSHDKYRRYVPSAEDNDYEDGIGGGTEPDFRDTVWESHIDAWEARLAAREAGDLVEPDS